MLLNITNFGALWIRISQRYCNQSFRVPEGVRHYLPTSQLTYPSRDQLLCKNIVTMF